MSPRPGLAYLKLRRGGHYWTVSIGAAMDADTYDSLAAHAARHWEDSTLVSVELVPDAAAAPPLTEPRP